MRIHRFIDPKQRDAAKRGANRSCKALNLSLDTINLRRFAHIESWIRPVSYTHLTLPTILRV